MAIAFARSRAGNTLARIDSVDGMTKAAPTPMIARDAMSTPDVSANTPSSEPSPKMTRPVCSAPLRPKRSPSAAAVKSSPRRHLQRRQGDVEHGVADDDDDQRSAQHRQRLPPAGIDVRCDAVEVVRMDRYGVVSKCYVSHSALLRLPSASMVKSAVFRYATVVIAIGNKDRV
jgi:hypothetical protein